MEFPAPFTCTIERVPLSLACFAYCVGEIDVASLLLCVVGDFYSRAPAAGLSGYLSVCVVTCVSGSIQAAVTLLVYAAKLGSHQGGKSPSLFVLPPAAAAALQSSHETVFL